MFKHFLDSLNYNYKYVTINIAFFPQLHAHYVRCHKMTAFNWNKNHHNRSAAMKYLYFPIYAWINVRFKIFFFFWKKCSIYVRRHKISDNILNRNIVNYVCRHGISAFWLRNLSIYNLRLNCCLKNNTRMILFQKSRECIIQRETNRLIAPDRR